eukprot:TRINITY_DN14509_c0_g1_i1.p1 TRINITY_DN14509_c0_g1~~TRINITY_DN14509_c0_g1_i1.p1  ORF type:complete len:865 (-),score=320.39 TRINITY_DN14509_c0_g1_i1:35-2629(-)
MVAHNMDARRLGRGHWLLVLCLLGMITVSDCVSLRVQYSGPSAGLVAKAEEYHHKRLAASNDAKRYHITGARLQKEAGDAKFKAASKESIAKDLDAQAQYAVERAERFENDLATTQGDVHNSEEAKDTARRHLDNAMHKAQTAGEGALMGEIGEDKDKAEVAKANQDITDARADESLALGEKGVAQTRDDIRGDQAEVMQENADSAENAVDRIEPEISEDKRQATQFAHDQEEAQADAAIDEKKAEELERAKAEAQDKLDALDEQEDQATDALTEAKADKKIADSRLHEDEQKRDKTQMSLAHEEQELKQDEDKENAAASKEALAADASLQLHNDLEDVQNAISDAKQKEEDAADHLRALERQDLDATNALSREKNDADRDEEKVKKADEVKEEAEEKVEETLDQQKDLNTKIKTEEKSFKTATQKRIKTGVDIKATRAKVDYIHEGIQLNLDKRKERYANMTHEQMKQSNLEDVERQADQAQHTATDGRNEVLKKLGRLNTDLREDKQDARIAEIKAEAAAKDEEKSHDAYLKGQADEHAIKEKIKETAHEEKEAKRDEKKDKLKEDSLEFKLNKERHTKAAAQGAEQDAAKIVDELKSDIDSDKADLHEVEGDIETEQGAVKEAEAKEAREQKEVDSIDSQLREAKQHEQDLESQLRATKKDEEDADLTASDNGAKKVAARHAADVGEQRLVHDESKVKNDESQADDLKQDQAISKKLAQAEAANAAAAKEEEKVAEEEATDAKNNLAASQTLHDQEKKQEHDAKQDVVHDQMDLKEATGKEQTAEQQQDSLESRISKVKADIEAHSNGAKEARQLAAAYSTTASSKESQAKEYQGKIADAKKRQHEATRNFEDARVSISRA